MILQIDDNNYINTRNLTFVTFKVTQPIDNLVVYTVKIGFITGGTKRFNLLSTKYDRFKKAIKELVL